MIKHPFLSIVCLLILYGIIVDSGNTSTNTTTVPTITSPNINQEPSNDETVNVGDEYTCSRDEYKRAVALAPTEQESEQIDSTRKSLEERNEELKALKNNIETLNVNGYSSRLNEYNKLIDEYNLKLTIIKKDVTKFESRINEYNAKIKAHTNYLDTTCTYNGKPTVQEVIVNQPRTTVTGPQQSRKDYCYNLRKTYPRTTQYPYYAPADVQKLIGAGCWTNK